MLTLDVQTSVCQEHVAEQADRVVEISSSAVRLHQLEDKERRLVERLKNTQAVQASAKMELERVILNGKSAS